jgi:hypothetical protein
LSWSRFFDALLRGDRRAVGCLLVWLIIVIGLLIRDILG